MSSAIEPENGVMMNLLGISCREKHALIFARWAALPVGAHFVLVNDHDPVPLYYQFAAQFPGAFDWTYLVQGPREFHVKITRVSSVPTRPPMAPPPPTCGTHRAAEDALDVRGLEPPEPMMRILAAFERLPAGASLRAHTERRPVLLFPELEVRGARFASEELEDGSWVTSIVRS